MRMRYAVELVSPTHILWCAFIRVKGLTKMACSSRTKGTFLIFEAGKSGTGTVYPLPWRIKPPNAHFLRSWGMKLRFCEESIATACVYYHKFYQIMDREDYNEHVSTESILKC